MRPLVLTRCAAAAVVLGALCCASAPRYRPRDWRPAGPGRWAASVEGVDLETTGLGASDGSLTTELIVHNASLSVVSVEGARLTTGSGSIECDPPPSDARAARSVPAGETRRVSLAFRVPDGGRLAEPVVLVLRLGFAAKTRQIEVALARGGSEE